MTQLRVWTPLLIAALLCGCSVLAADSVTTAPSDVSPSPTATSAPPDVPPDGNPGVIMQEFPAGGPRNQVHLLNQQDGRFLARASVRLSQVGSDTVKSQNIAIAEARCTDCQTIAIALQIVLYKRGASNVQPVNVAIAENVGCTRCITIARAIQYAIPVDDPNAVPSDVRQLVSDMQRELNYFASVHTLAELDPQQAQARLDAVMAQYAELAQFFTQQQDARRTGDDQRETPLASPTASPTTSPSPSVVPSPSATVAPSATTSAAPSPSASPSGP